MSEISQETLDYYSERLSILRDSIEDACQPRSVTPDEVRVRDVMPGQPNLLRQVRGCHAAYAIGRPLLHKLRGQEADDRYVPLVLDGVHFPDVLERACDPSLKTGLVRTMFIKAVSPGEISNVPLANQSKYVELVEGGDMYFLAYGQMKLGSMLGTIACSLRVDIARDLQRDNEYVMLARARRLPKSQTTAMTAWSMSIEHARRLEAVEALRAARG